MAGDAPSLPWWDERLAVPHAPADEQPGEEAPSRRRTATIDLDDGYVRELVLRAFRLRPGWAVTEVRAEGETVAPEASASDFHWGEYERIDWERVHQGEQVASCYCVRKGLIRKAHLAHNLRKWGAKHPGGRLARAVPLTLVMVLDDPDYFEEALADVYEVRDMAPGSQRWIAKPSITNQALGVRLFDCVPGLRAALQEQPDLREWVLQRYIERPLLVRGRKFHLRAYALCVGSLRCYVFSEMLALFAAELYTRGERDLGNLRAHLTNTCAARGTGVQEEDLVCLASELPQALAADGWDPSEAARRVEAAHADVREVIGECIDAVSSELTFFTLPNCFELFGFDLLLDEAWNVWLLEANAEPDMKQTGERLKPLIGDLVEGVLRLVADGEDYCRSQQQAQEAESPGGAGRGRWIRVLDKQQRLPGAASNMRML